MTWGQREAITLQEARELGLDHDIRPGDLIFASPTRKSIVIDGGWPTGFIRRKGGWRVVLYDSYMGGHFQRRPDSESIPYDEWKKA